MSNWPSPLPGPAWQKWRNCWDHLEATVFTDLPLETYNRLRQRPIVRKAEERAGAMAHSGDVLATNTACNAWVRAWAAVVKDVETLEGVPV